jgi:hypothetical protein
MVMVVQVTVKSPDLKRLSKQIRLSGNPKRIRRDMTTALKKGAKPGVLMVKGAALSLPSRGKGHTGMRTKMARSTSAQVRTSGKEAGVYVRVNRRAMGDQASLAAATNNGRWRHPVRGNRKVWVTQYSNKGWFDRAAVRASPPVRKEVKGVLNKIEHELTQH